MHVGAQPLGGGALVSACRHVCGRAAVWAAAMAANGAVLPAIAGTRSLPASPRRCAPPSPARSLGGSVSRTSSIAMPELQRQLTEGVRPGWNLELTGAASSSSSQARFCVKGLEKGLPKPNTLQPYP